MDWDWGEDLWRFILIIGMIIFTIILCISGYIYDKNYIHYYKYIDWDNNEGIAISCQFSDKDNNNRNGGQGNPICKLEDGTIVSVKSYKYIEEKIK